MDLYSSTMIRTQFDSLLASVVALQESHSSLSRKIDKVVSSAAQYAEALSAFSKEFSAEELPDTNILTSTFSSYGDTEPTKEGQMFIPPTIATGSHISSELVEPGIDLKYPTVRHEAVTNFIGIEQFIVLDDFGKMLNMEFAPLLFDEMLTRPIFEALGAPNRDTEWHYFIESRMLDVHRVLLMKGLTYNEQLPISVENVIQIVPPMFRLTYVVVYPSCPFRLCSLLTAKYGSVIATSSAYAEIEYSIATRMSLLVPFVDREVVLPNEHLKLDIPARYVDANSLDSGSTTWKIDLEAFEDVYIVEFFMDPVGSEEFFVAKYFLDNESAISTSAIHHVEVLLDPKKGNSTGLFTGQQILCQFPIVPVVDFLIVTIPLTAVNLSVWDPGIGFKFLALTGYTTTMEELLWLGCIGKSLLLAYLNSMRRVGDPKQPCVPGRMEIVGGNGDEHLVRSMFYRKWSFRICAHRLIHHLFAGRNCWFAYTVTNGDVWVLHGFDNVKAAVIGAICSSLLIVYTFQVLYKDEVRFMYNLVFGKGVLVDAPLVYEFFLYLNLGDYSFILGLQLAVELQMRCSKTKSINKSTCLVVVLQEPEIKVLALTLQCGGNFSNSKNPKILVDYLKLVWLLILRELNYSKTSYFMNLLLQTLPHAPMLTKHFLSIEPTYKVLFLYSWWPHLALVVYKQHDTHKLFISGLQQIHTKAHRALLCNTYSTAFLVLRDKALLHHKEMDNLWINVSACWTRLTLWLVVHDSFSFLESNLEDKVLIEGGSIVVNVDYSHNSYGPIIWTKSGQVVGPRAKTLKGQGISQPNKRFTWDPG